MHGWIDSEISAILFALIVIVVASLAFTHQVTLKSNQRFKESQKLEIGFGALVEREAQVKLYNKSMLVTHSKCIICQNPTTRRCSRCKLSKYCSPKCQVVHWKESHKNECCPPKEKVFESEINNCKKMCNGKQLKTSRGANSTIILNPITLRCFKSDSKKPRKDINKLAKIQNFLRPKTLLFSYKYFVKLFEWEGLNKPCGLINCGNSCFANVVLQCLTYTRPLTAYLLEGCHGEDCSRDDWCFMCELQTHVYKVRHSQNPFSPLRILSRIRNISNHLGYGRQEDAHEFMRFAIDSMQSICLDEVGGEKMIDLATQETTLIHHIFGGHLQSQVKCMQCKHESNRYESMMDLAVEIHGLVESLEDAISQFTTIEMLDGDNKYKCDICNAYVKAQKQLTLYEAPNILTIALKRFQSGKFGKLNKRVTFPEVLDMSPYMSEKQAKFLLYRLYALVVHIDMLNASFFGHYICYVKDSNGLWYKIDDNKVKEVELEKVLVQRAYMLFYSRLEARKEPPIEGLAPTTLSSCLTSNTINTSNIRFQKSSNIPISIDEIPVLANFSKENFNKGRALQFNLSKETTIEYKSASKTSTSIVDKDFKDIKLELGLKGPPICMNNVENDDNLVKASSFSNTFVPQTNSPISRTSNGSFASQTLNCNFSCNRHTEKNEFPLNTQRTQYAQNNVKSTHEHNSLLRSLDMNKLEDITLQKIDKCSIKSNSKKFEENPLIIEGSIVGEKNSFQKSNLNHAIRHQNYAQLCDPYNEFVEMGSSNISEANVLNDIGFEKIKGQHIEDIRKNLDSSSTSSSSEFDDMNIGCKGTSSIGKAMESNSTPHTSSSHNATIPSDLLKVKKICDHFDILESSNNLLSSERFQCCERTLDVKRCELESYPRMQEEDLHFVDQRHQLNALQENFCIQSLSNEGNTLVDNYNFKQYNLKTSKKNDEVEFQHAYPIEPLQEDSWVQQSCHEDQILIDELPPLMIHGKKETSTRKTTQSGLEIYEESYDIRPFDDDLPYVVVEALSTQSTILQSYKEKSTHQEDFPCQSIELQTIKMENTTQECIHKEILDIGNTDDVESFKEPQSKINIFVVDTKFKKNETKPLFFSGFLNRSSKSIVTNSLNKNVVPNGCGCSNENIHGELIEQDEKLSNWRYTSIPIINGEEHDDQRLKCVSTSNCIHGTGMLEPNNNSKDIPSKFGRKNSASIVM